MRKYQLRNGYSVETQKVAGDQTEFTTRNAEGEVISTVTKGRAEARELFISMRVATCLRARG